MKKAINPFEFDGADKLSKEQIVSFFTDDFNYQRFIWSKRNIFLTGERGTGKTMTLRYYSLPVQIEKAKQEENEIDLSIACIHISCNTPLTSKREHELLDDFPASTLSEHFLVISMMDAIVKSIQQIPDVLKGVETAPLQSELEYLWGIKFPNTGRPFIEKLIQVIFKQSVNAQKVANSHKLNNLYEDALSFSSGVIPLLNCFRKAPKLKDTHFALMMDDVHDLNIHQIKALNSWISYRDNTAFSFKVATAKVDDPVYATRSGGTILPDHDFINVDMSSPFRDKASPYGKLARKLVKIRLENADIKGISPDDFFPIHPGLSADLKLCEVEALKEAQSKYPEGSDKKIQDYVYKYKRVLYFRKKVTSTANRPPYSGFDLMVHMSTGVIRHLLMPCYFMFDRMTSELTMPDQRVTQITPAIQTEVIRNISQQKWQWLEKHIANSIEGCSRQQGKQIYQLFDNLAVLFRERLIHHKSEPRALTFTISGKKFHGTKELMELIKIARKAQYLFCYKGSGKDSGKREDYYAPLRILMAERKLDPVGQHAVISLQASNLWAAATQNTKIPLTSTSIKGQNNSPTQQQILW